MQNVFIQEPSFSPFMSITSLSIRPDLEFLEGLEFVFLILFLKDFLCPDAILLKEG